MSHPADVVPTGASPVERLHPLLRDRIAERLGWPDLRPAQKLAIAPILDGANTLVLAPTAGGKTEAAFFPLLSMLRSAGAVPLSVLYLSPLKALLNNQDPRLVRLAGLVDRTAFRWHGDVEDGPKRAFLRQPADILLITPESLEGLFVAGLNSLFANLRAVVVDEIHAFAGTDRGSHLLALIDRVAAAAGRDVQRIGLSATVGNPAELLGWLAGRSRRARVVVDPPRDGVKRYFRLVRVASAEAEAVAAAAVPVLRGRKAMFFVDARRIAEGLRPHLAAAGIDVRVHHASVDRRLRDAAEAAVSRGGPTCLLCTSTMELGVDVGDVDAVLQLGAPATVASYLQRMGRSGRRGTPGLMVVLAGDREGFIRAVALTELARRRWVEPVRLRDRDWAVYVQQMLATILARRTVRPADQFAALARCAAFAGIRRAEYEAVVDHLCAAGYLERSGGGRLGAGAERLRLAHRAEREFGGGNWADLRSVFDGGAAQLTVYSGGEAVGTVDRSFAARIKEGGEFTLAGHNWRPERIDWGAARIEVAPGAAGGMPSWRGGGATPVATEVALEIRRLLLADGYPAYLDGPERAYLAELRAEAREAGLAPGIVPLHASAGTGGPSKRLTLLTLAGERVNRTLGLYLDGVLATASHADRERLVLVAPEAGGKRDPRAAAAALADLGPRGFDEAALRDTRARVPVAGASRFLRLLPPVLAAEAVSADALDFPAAAAFLREHRVSVEAKTCKRSGIQD